MKLIQIDTTPDGARREREVKGMPTMPAEAQRLAETLNNLARRPTDSRYKAVQDSYRPAAA